MSKMRALRKALLSRKTAFIGGATAGGYAAGFTSGLPGFRSESGKEGAAVAGLLTAGAVLGAPVVFRRIRGRIIPIRIKK